MFVTIMTMIITIIKKGIYIYIVIITIIVITTIIIIIAIIVVISIIVKYL